MKKPSDIFRDMMSDHFSKNRNDEVPDMQQKFSALREAICDYLDETLPAMDNRMYDNDTYINNKFDMLIERLEQKVEQLEKKLDSSKMEHTKGNFMFISSTEKDYTCPECGEKYRGGHVCKRSEPKPECEHDWDVAYYDWQGQRAIRTCKKPNCNKKQRTVTIWEDVK